MDYTVRTLFMNPDLLLVFLQAGGSERKGTGKEKYSRESNGKKTLKKGG